MMVGMLETRPPLPALPHPAPKARSRPHARSRAEQAAPLAAIHVLILAWLAHLLTLADLLHAARSLTPHPLCELDETEPQPNDATNLSRELMSLLRILYRIGARPARGMRALPSRVPPPRRTPPNRPPPAPIPPAAPRLPPQWKPQTHHAPPFQKKRQHPRLTTPRHPPQSPAMQTPRPATRFWYRWQYTPAV